MHTYELPDWDLTVALHIYLFMIVLGVRFASSYPIYLKKQTLTEAKLETQWNSLWRYLEK